MKPLVPYLTNTVYRCLGSPGRLQRVGGFQSV